MCEIIRGQHHVTVCQYLTVGNRDALIQRLIPVFAFEVNIWQLIHIIDHALGDQRQRVAVRERDDIIHIVSGTDACAHKRMRFIISHWRLNEGHTEALHHL